MAVLGALSASPPAQWPLAASQGYVLARQVLHADTLLGLQAELRARLAVFGWAVAEGERLRAKPGGQLSGSGFDDPAWLALQQQVQGSAAWQLLLHDPGLRALAAAVLGPEPHDYAGGVVRAMFPQSLHQTPPHQDAFYLAHPGLVWVFWTPLWPCELGDGGLGLVPGSHTQGLLSHDTTILGQPAATLRGDERWQTAALHPGDVLAMHALTLHQALANAGPWLRVSVDVRWAK